MDENIATLATKRGNDPLPSSVYALFSSGAPITVHLLTSEPSTSDITTWQEPLWDGYEPENIVPVIFGQQPNVIYCRLSWPWFLEDAKAAGLWGIGLEYEGNGFFAWPILSKLGAGNLSVEMSLSLVQLS